MKGESFILTRKSGAELTGDEEEHEISDEFEGDSNRGLFIAEVETNALPGY